MRNYHHAGRLVHDDLSTGQVSPHRDQTSLLLVCTSLIPLLRSEEVGVWREVLVGGSDRQDAESIDSPDLEIDWDLEVEEEECTLAGGPRRPLPTYS